MKSPKPRDHAEEIALFRSQVIGALTHQSLDRGQLQGALRELSGVPRRAPGSKLTRKYSLSSSRTLVLQLQESWAGGPAPTLSARSGPGERAERRATRAAQRDSSRASKCERGADPADAGAGGTNHQK